MEFLYEYGLFVAKAVTIVVAIAIVVGLIVGAAAKGKPSGKGELHVDNVSEDIEHDIQEMKRLMLNKEEQKAFDKQLKKEKKQAAKKHEEKSKLFIVNFNGSVDAAEVEALREEISAIISIAEPNDKVLIKLESPGGVVHGYGLAASQIARLRNANIETIAAVDKVAASGGYMMACVANKIIAAPFSIIGSIGVVAQLPNINRLLKKYDVDIEQHTAGNYKRTLTVFGENTEEGREKFKQELSETHDLFKQFVTDYRPQLNIEEVATGEHWYGTQALEKQLIDEIKTSDDFILESLKEYTLYNIEYKIKKNMAEKLGFAAGAAITQAVGKLSTWSITNAK